MSAQAPASPPPPGGSLARSSEVPLFYRRGFRNVLQQAIYVAATAIVAWYVYTSLDLREFGFGFLSEPAGFAVGSQWLIDVDGVTNSRLTMYLVGVWASLRAVLVAILLSTIVGVIVGVMSWSSAAVNLTAYAVPALQWIEGDHQYW